MPTYSDYERGNQIIARQLFGNVPEIPDNADHRYLFNVHLSNLPRENPMPTWSDNERGHQSIARQLFGNITEILNKMGSTLLFCRKDIL